MTKSEAKRFKMENPSKQKFTKTDLAKYYNIYRQMPEQVSLGAQKNFMKFAEWAADEWETHANDFNEAFFRQIIALKILFQGLDDIVKHADWYSLGYKGPVDIYTLSWFFYLIQDEYPSYELDFKKIWNAQSIPDDLKSILEGLAYVVYGHLTSDDRPVVNVTEYAKKKECWEKLKATPVKLNENIRRYLINESELKEEKKEAKEKQKEDNSINAMTSVWEYGTDSWKKALSFGRMEKVLTPKEDSILSRGISLILKGSFPSEKQCVSMMDILAKLREESFPG